MPVYEYGHGGHKYQYSSSSAYTTSTSKPSPTYSSSYAPYSYYPTSYSNVNNYYPSSNYNNPNILSTITSAGINAKYNIGQSNYAYKTRGQYAEKYKDRNKSYNPSPYTTYSLWKENQYTSKWRNENYRWNNQVMKDIGAGRAARPLFVDTSKINFNKPRQRDPASPPPRPTPSSSEQSERLVEKPIERSEKYGTIQRGRTVVRMHTKMLKENPYLKKTEPKAAKEMSPPINDRECKFNRLSPVRISRLKKRSVLQYNRNDSGSKNWLDSESSSSESDDSNTGSVKRKSTIKAKQSRSGTLKREQTLKKPASVLSHDNIAAAAFDATDKKQNRRFSTEMLEEQTAIFDKLIKEEFAREDADNYFSDPRRGTVKIKKSSSNAAVKAADSFSGHNTDSTDEEDSSKRKEAENDSDSMSEKDTPCASRRNSLFQDLIIGDPITESFIEELENKIQNSYTNPEKVLGKKDGPKKKIVGKNLHKITRKPSKLESLSRSTSDATIQSIAEVEEGNRPKTPKYFPNTNATEKKFLFEENNLLKQKTDSKIDKLPLKMQNMQSTTNKPTQIIEGQTLEKASDISASKPERIIKKPNLIECPKGDVEKNCVAGNGDLKPSLDVIQNDPSAESLKKAGKSLTEMAVIAEKASQGIQISELNIQKTATEKHSFLLDKATNDQNTVNKSVDSSCTFIATQNVAAPSKTSPTCVKNNVNNAICIKDAQVKVTSQATEKSAHDSKFTLPKDNSTASSENVKKKTENMVHPNSVLTPVNKTPGTEEVKILPKSETINRIVTGANETDVPELLKEVNNASNERNKINLKEQSTTTFQNSEKSQNLKNKDIKANNVQPQTTNFFIKIDESAKHTNNCATAELDRNEKSVSQDSQVLSANKTTQKDNTTPDESANKIDKAKEGKLILKQKQLKKLEKETSEKGVIENVTSTSKDVINKADCTLSKRESGGKKQTVRKSKALKKPSAIMHMKPRAMATRTIEMHPPSLKTPRLASLPKPKKAIIEIIPQEEPADEGTTKDEEEDEEGSSTEEEEETDSDEYSDSSSGSTDSKQGKHCNSTSSLDSGFGSACYKIRKGISLQHRVVN